MDRNRGSFHAIIALLFICLSLRIYTVSGKAFKSTNRTGGYTPQQQSVRPITVGKNALNEWNNNNNNIKNSNNFTKVSAKNDVNSGSDIYFDSDSNSRESEWSLRFDPNYFASLNAANHRPIDTMIGSSTDSQSKITPTSSTSATSSSSTSADNMFYYSPETYGKTSHKNHKTNSFAYLYPSSSSTTTTTSTSTTPSPKISDNRFGESSGNSAPSGYSEPAPPYTHSLNSKDKHSSTQLNYEETPEEEEEPTYYDTNEEIGRKYYYPTRNRPKHYSVPDYYGSDLSSMSTSNENSKIKSAVNGGITSYGAQEETDIGHNVETYESGGNIRFPSKYYGGGGGGTGYYSSYYPPSYYPSASEHSFSGSDSLLHRSTSWLGPGMAGLLLGIGLPLGILVATMIPAFMSVPIVSTATVGRKKRQLSDFDIFGFNNTQIFLNSGVFEIISKYGMSSLEDPKCLSEMFCTFAANGRNSDKNLIQNIVYHIIDWTPNRLAKWFSLDKLFNAIKHNRCETIYKCMSKKIKFKDTDRYNN